MELEAGCGPLVVADTPVTSCTVLVQEVGQLPRVLVPRSVLKQVVLWMLQGVCRAHNGEQQLAQKQAVAAMLRDVMDPRGVKSQLAHGRAVIVVLRDALDRFGTGRVAHGPGGNEMDRVLYAVAPGTFDHIHNQDRREDSVASCNLVATKHVWASA